MRILYVGLRYDYGKPEQGYSFGYHNFFHTLHSLGHDVIYFDSLTAEKERGREEAGRRLVEIAKAEKPDLLFAVLFTEQFPKESIREITDAGQTITFNWFCDDHWRFDNYSQFWAPQFRYVSTTDSASLPKYHAMGYENVIRTQWACNPFLYRKLDLPLIYDVTFVGQPHGWRSCAIEKLRSAGLNVTCRGQGWPEGRLDQEEMIAFFNQSRVNLNFAYSSVPVNFAAKCLAKFPNLAMKLGLENKLYRRQIKGRNFEIPGCGGLLLTDVADNIADYYQLDEEIAVAEGIKGFAKRIKQLLDDEPSRAAIAQAGYDRTIREHTYVHRLNDIFGRIGLPKHATELPFVSDPGNVEYVH